MGQLFRRPSRPRSVAAVQSSRRKDSILEVPVRDVTADYTFHRLLGEGHYGKVRRAMNKQTKERVAIKTIAKARIRNPKSLQREVSVLQSLVHPNIVRFIDVYEDPLGIHLVLELCTGGELFDRIASEQFFSEAKAASITRQILSAVAYMHSKGIVHRDLKPENILFANEVDDTVKVADFGLSRHFEVTDIMHTRAGTAYYMSPEVLRRSYSEACDVWSVGCICYVMLAGYPPFYADSESEVFKMILNDPVKFPSPEWDLISDAASVFVTALLNKNPAERPTADDALKLEWLTQANYTGEISPRTLLSLKAFVNSSKFKRKLLSEMSKKLSVDELTSLRKEFDLIDINHDGVISADEIAKAVLRTDSKLKAGLAPLLRHVNFSLDWDSFIKAAGFRREFLRKDRLAEIFAQLDLDRSGKLSISEIRTALGDDKNINPDPKLLEEISRYDVNKDGVLDFEEVVAMLEKDADPATTELAVQ